MDNLEEQKYRDSGQDSESSPDVSSDMQTKALQILRERDGWKSMSFAELLKIVPHEQRELRMIFRRLRNQESAAKSSPRRKRRLEALRANLVDISDRLRESKDRYQQLAEENVKLRSALGYAQKHFRLKQ